MILSFAKALKNRNINYQKQLLVKAIDISDVCIYMTYIQLSLYGIPAIVYCGNTLTGEIRFKMETPLYFLQYWKFQKFFTQNNKDDNKEIERNESEDINQKSIENLLKEVTVKGNTQFSLW